MICFLLLCLQSAVLEGPRLGERLGYGDESAGEKIME